MTNLTEILFYSGISVLVADGVWIILFVSPLVPHLLGFLTKQSICTHTEVEDYLLSKSCWFLHGLWTCTTCQSVWSSVLAALLFWCVTGCDFLLVPLVFLSLLPIVKWTQNQLNR